MKKFLDIRAEVRDAIADLRPVVAFNSPAVLHSVPPAASVETAIGMEATVRRYQVVPATVGVLNGRIIVGLTADEMERLAFDQNVVAVGQADLASFIVRKKSGATMVPVAMRVTVAAGIRFFSTNELGGIELGTQPDLNGLGSEMPAELMELSRCPVAVVCGGLKAMVDVSRTLEVLKTFGVPVIDADIADNASDGVNISHHPFQSNHPFETSEQLAHLIKTHWELGFESGVLITNLAASAAPLVRQQSQQHSLKIRDSAGLAAQIASAFWRSKAELNDALMPNLNA